MIKLCIFDLDGTVLNTLETIAYYGNEALEKYGIEPVAANTYKSFIGAGIYNLIKNMLNYRNVYSEEMFDKVFNDYNKAYNGNSAFRTEPYEGIIELIDNLRANGIKTAIVSNKPDYPTKCIIKEIFGEGYFDYAVGQREGIPIKPDPYSILEIMSFENLEKDECIYVGDSGSDMKEGKNAGIFSVGVLWGFRDEKDLSDNGADLIIKEPAELYEFIKNVNKNRNSIV